MTAATEASLRAALAAAGLAGRRAVVHSSLRSFGLVEGGAATVARALSATLETLLVPTCCWGEGSAECAPPPGELWRQNGRDEGQQPGHVPVPFELERTLPVPAMGAIPRAVFRLPGVTRGRHPLVSFAAVGREAARYTAGQHALEPHFPLTQLAADGGLVVLMGVNLTRCTALHVAEQRAGVRPFVRWALGRGGERERVLVGGCSEGFERLWPALSPLFRVQQVASSTVRIAELESLIARAAELLAAERGVASCADSACPRCRDARLGGPLPPS